MQTAVCGAQMQTAVCGAQMQTAVCGAQMQTAVCGAQMQMPVSVLQAYKLPRVSSPTCSGATIFTPTPRATSSPPATSSPSWTWLLRTQRGGLPPSLPHWTYPRSAWRPPAACCCITPGIRTSSQLCPRRQPCTWPYCKCCLGSTGNMYR